MASRWPAVLAATGLALAVPLRAQHEGHEIDEKKAAAESRPEAEPEPRHGAHAPGLLGPYPMSREASGTAWQPEAAPHEALVTRRGAWDLMLHGVASLSYSDQGGPRGDAKLFSSNMLMGLARRRLGPGALGLRGMVSAEPFTVGKRGYPLLLQTGETADGRTPLIDRQHPHDLLMELAAVYSLPLDGGSSLFVYAGLPGEPALGPPAFMHRLSSMENPAAPLAHHWLDSTHISFGVATLGWVNGNAKLEASLFNGREPDEERADLETGRLDSWAARASYNPGPGWAVQGSFGRLAEPEQLHPGVDVDRTTISLLRHGRPRAESGQAQVLLAWGRNRQRPGETLDAFLLEGALAWREGRTLLARAERQENNELFAADPAHPLHDRRFWVSKVSLGYLHDLLRRDRWRLAAGALGSVARVPRALEASYGDLPVSTVLFLRWRLGAQAEPGSSAKSLPGPRESDNHP